MSAIRSRDISAEMLTATFLSRIEKQNPKINAVRHVLADEAIENARAIDDALARGEELGPLAGMPVLIKENCDTIGAVCSAGLSFRETHHQKKDSWITNRLRASGANILGVSVSSPGAFDVRTLHVTNPTNSEMTVGGSSGGSAAALAAGFCLGAIGTDTGGSIRIPSACCGTVGLKPTFGALAMDGIFPLVSSLDHVGPMARSVEDLELIWSALSTRTSLNHEVAKTVGIDRKWLGEADPEIRLQFELLEKRLTALNIKIVDVTLPDPDTIVDMHLCIFVVESAAYHLSHHSDHLQSYPQIARDGFGAANDRTVADYVNAYKKRVLFTKQVDAVLAHVDFLITPTLASFQPRRMAEELKIGGAAIDFTSALVRNTCLFDHTGHPALAMPFPTSDLNLTSMQIVGGNHQEHALLSFGAGLESHGF